MVHLQRSLQLTPLPLAWDRTSLSQPAPTSDKKHLPDATRAGAAAVYKFLDAQSRKLGSWAGPPLWSVVDGPFKLRSFTTEGGGDARPEHRLLGLPKAFHLTVRGAAVHERNLDL